MRLEGAKAMVTIIALSALTGLFADVRDVSAQSSERKLDFSFQNTEPYRKKKRAADLSAIKTEADLAVVRAAISPIMKFLYGISQTNLSDRDLRGMTTTEGFNRLRLPPILDQYNRYGARYMRDWKVVDPHTIVFTADFYGILDTQGPYTSTFVFSNVDSEWKFDRHDL